MREWVGLGALGVALVIGALFYSVSAGDADVSPRAPEAIATTAPHAIQGESPWTITFLAAGEPESIISQSQVEALNFSYKGPPFLDVKDDQWRLLPVTQFNGPAAEYAGLVTYEGEISLSVDGQDVQVTPAQGKGTVAIPFTKLEGQPVMLRVSVRDTGGPMTLKWQLTKR